MLAAPHRVAARSPASRCRLPAANAAAAAAAIAAAVTAAAAAAAATATVQRRLDAQLRRVRRRQLLC